MSSPTSCSLQGGSGQRAPPGGHPPPRRLRLNRQRAEPAPALPAVLQKDPRDRAPTPQPLTNCQGHGRRPRGDPAGVLAGQSAQCPAPCPGSCLPAQSPRHGRAPGLPVPADAAPEKRLPRPCLSVPEVQTGPEVPAAPAPVAQQSGPGDKAGIATVAAWDRGDGTLQAAPSEAGEAAHTGGWASRGRGRAAGARAATHFTNE